MRNCLSASIQSLSGEPGWPMAWRFSAIKYARNAMSSLVKGLVRAGVFFGADFRAAGAFLGVTGAVFLLTGAFPLAGVGFAAGSIDFAAGLARTSTALGGETFVAAGFTTRLAFGAGLASSGAEFVGLVPLTAFGESSAATGSLTFRFAAMVFLVVVVVVLPISSKRFALDTSPYWRLENAAEIYDAGRDVNSEMHAKVHEGSNRGMRPAYVSEFASIVCNTRNANSLATHSGATSMA